MPELALVNGRVVTPFRTVDPGNVIVEGRFIKAVGPSARVAVPEGARTLDCTGYFVVPGFVDLHVHGGGGSEAMEGTTEALRRMARYHAAGGTTSLLPTTLCAPEAEIHRALDAIGAMQGVEHDGAEILGAHLEGPFISMSERGAQNPAFVRSASSHEVDRLLERADVIRVMTAAPEVPGGLELGQRMHAAGVLMSIGHSSAFYPDVVRAVEAGYRHVTHLYCGMSRWVNERGKKTAGVSESALLLDELSVELIADGNHVSPHMMELAIRMKGPNMTCLVTDCILAAGLPPGEYSLGGVKFVLTPTAARLADDSGNAGSILRMGEAVRNVVRMVGVSLQDAVRMASLTPARRIRMDHRKGSLSPGKDADIVILTPELDVAATIVGGRVVYCTAPEFGAACGDAQQQGGLNA